MGSGLGSIEAGAMGFVRVAVVSPELRVADVGYNVRQIIEAMERLAAEGVRLAVFPELCITGYSCADLFYQETLLRESLVSLQELAVATAKLRIAVVVAFPLAVDGRLYNCAALLSGGAVNGIVPKTYLPSTKEYYEGRWFASGRSVRGAQLQIAGREVPFGVDLIFKAQNFPACVVGIEICEDLWAAQPPSGSLSIAGATVIVNPSASNELLGKMEYRRDLVRQQSARCLAAYLYAGAGPGESTTDTVFGGHSMIVENGVTLAETERFRFDTQQATADVDVQLMNNERVCNSCFSADPLPTIYREVRFELPEPEVRSADAARLQRPVLRTPFVPYDQTQRAKNSREIVAIQSTGLAKRLRHTRSQTAVIGVSGGLDSTLALLTTLQAFDRAGLPRSGILGVMMPGFGTSDRTRANAMRLISLLEVTPKVVDIGPAVRQHFVDIGHDESRHDVTYENSQARERTQILMDLANKHSGLVVGTGDLSEMALGWCTYNGDHMSMYHVNAGVPKTLVRSVVEWCADELFAGEISGVLHDICDTPISPELLPLADNGVLAQRTEDYVGPYELHDFFLFHVVRHQFTPQKIVFLAQQAFAGDYSDSEIRRWLEVFYRRFFSQQFKRSATPDGPKIGTVALSPRADWRMPSDGSPETWLK